MSIDFNLNALLVYLREKGLQPELQKESGQIFIIYQIKGFEIPVFFLLRKESHLLQSVAYLPYKLNEKTLGESARMLHILNKELDMPGFCLDETEKLMFYRAAIPCLHGKIDTELFNMYLGVARIACETFMHTIGLIVSGTVSVNEMMGEKKEPNA